jgi:hypothetical protein
MTYKYNGHEETESRQTHCDVHRPEISWCKIAREDGSYTALVSSAKSDVLQVHLRCTCGVSDQLIEADCSTSLEMALSVVANPSDIETRCDVETHGDDKEGKVSPSHSWYSREQNVAYDISRVEPSFWVRTRTDEVERHAQDNKWTSHLVLVAEVGHKDEGAASNCLYRYGQ